MHCQVSAPSVVTVMPATVPARQEIFLVERNRWFHYDVYSNHLTGYVVLAVAVLVTSFILASLLSLSVNIPSLYYVIKVRMSEKACKEIC